MEKLLAPAHFPDAKLITIDRLRVEFPDSWAVVPHQIPPRV